MKSKRAFLLAPRKFEIRETELTMRDDQMIIQNASCGLCTWDLNFWKGILRTDEYPYPLGHEYAGTVIAVGKNVSGFQPGDKVASLSGYQGFGEHAVCDPARSFKLAEDIDPKYALAEPVKCVTTVLQAASPCPGDYGVVLGCGPMGIWAIQALSGGYLSGLIAIDIDDRKLDLARKFGATLAINPKRENAYEAIAEYTHGHLADFLIEGTGVPEVLEQAMDYLKPSGRAKLLLMSSHQRGAASFDFRKAITKAIDLHIPHPLHALNPMDDLRRAVSLLNQGTYQIKPLVTHEFPLSLINEAFDTLEHRPDGYLKGLVYPD